MIKPDPPASKSILSINPGSFDDGPDRKFKKILNLYPTRSTGCSHTGYLVFFYIVVSISGNDKIHSNPRETSKFLRREALTLFRSDTSFLSGSICQLSQYLGTKLNKWLKVTKSVEIAIGLRKQLFYLKIIDLIQNDIFLIPLFT